eukprot:2674617-Prymnesium_polylepis.1
MSRDGHLTDEVVGSHTMAAAPADDGRTTVAVRSGASDVRSTSAASSRSPAPASSCDDRSSHRVLPRCW